MRAAILTAIIAAGPAAGADWNCAGDICELAQPLEAASQAGSFSGAGVVSEAGDPDHFAAMEQQRWREFRFKVIARTRVTAEIAITGGTLPADWPADVLPDPAVRLALFQSDDGERYSKVENATILQAGTQLSVLLAQQTESLGDSGQRFHPAEFLLSIRAVPLVGANASRVDPAALPLVPVREGVTLGCTPDLCARLIQDAPVTAVAGSPNVSGLPRAEPEDRPDARPTDATGALNSEMQSELARLGCYDAAVDGLWGPASRRAMADFNAVTGDAWPTDVATPKALVAAARKSEPLC